MCLTFTQKKPKPCVCDWSFTWLGSGHYRFPKDPTNYTQKNIPWYRQGKNSLSKIPFISRDSFPLCSREISFSSKGIDPYVWMVGNFCFFVAGKSLFKGTIPLIIPYLTGKLLVGISSPWNRIPLAAGNLHWGQKWRNIPLFFTSKQGNIFLSVAHLGLRIYST